ncbi:MAG: hypothetical protein GTO51_00905 [Candidatus Latescibacteria bacterium]|nr:hypothetical protein [Candidatus Latescibacterota bacterium]NIM21282.1 hypothetical protein [Candidatus Latescibacterota bacterium]NIM64540.1 hypothetical protein [Candidatus Latescibacterota bacterium]NIO00697.1 hypothetical protein [Candidatus Latescibacterota bacterium]NIO27096.1 hypothetical protein [Candidatus Latescibacterota bacterium]
MIKRIFLWCLIPVSIPLTLGFIDGPLDAWRVTVTAESLIAGILVGLWYGALIKKRRKDRSKNQRAVRMIC